MTSEKTKSELELRPDAWQRFERAVDVVAKSAPQHRSKSKVKTARAKKPRKQQRSG